MAELSAIIKKIRNIMRKDPGISGDAQRLEQITWLLFLKIYDAKEEEWELVDDDYVSIIPDRFKWRNWAVDNKDGKALTGDALLHFIDDELFPTLNGLEITADTSNRQAIVKAALEGIHNYMKNGTFLREAINTLDEIDFNKLEDRHAFGDIYESMLKELQSQGKAGEFYTPRAVTDFIIKVIDPQLGERIADFACGTGGFLTSSLNYFKSQVKTTSDQKLYANSVYGADFKPLPYILCITNMILHDVDNPQIYHMDSLAKNVREYSHEEKFDVIVMNPPYGASVDENDKINFPPEFRSAETADMFLVLIMYRLKQYGRAAVILPPGIMFGKDDVKIGIKKHLLENFNLHTIVRLPRSVFAPYTPTQTNILFFDNTGPTKETWFYRMDMPEGYKHFSKTKPIKFDHMIPVIDWINHKVEIYDDETDSYKAKCFSISDIKKANYDLDYCKYPKIDDEILSPNDTILGYKKARQDLNENIDKVLLGLEQVLNESVNEVDSSLKNVLLTDLNTIFVQSIRRSILQSAIQGNLCSQSSSDSSVLSLLDSISSNSISYKRRTKRNAIIPLFKRGDMYYEYSDSEEKEVSVPFSIPDSWIWVKLADVCTYIHRGKSPIYSTVKKYPVVAQKCNQWSGLDMSKCLFIDPLTIDKYDKLSYLRDYDILVNSTGTGTCGRTGVYDSSLNEYELAVADSHVTVIRTLIDPMYVYYFLSSPEFQDNVEDMSNGSTNQIELSTSTLENLLIPLPPLEEQKRIVAKVSKSLSLISRLKIDG